MFQPQPTPFASSTFLVAPPLPPPLYGHLDGASDFDLQSALAGPQYASHGPQPHHHELQRLPQKRQRRLLPQQHPQRYSPIVKMEDQDQHGLEAQQAAARDYKAAFEGSSVGDKTDITAITQEYAKADPVYVEKTMTLPQTYSHYRPIRGDGNCGWRAIGFAYFEKLLEIGDQGQIEGEVARLTSLNHMIGSTGGYSYFEDFADEAIGLLRDVAASISNPDVARLLVHQRWNDDHIGPAIIYYLRLLTATYLKTNEATYGAFIPDLGVQGYCSQSIEPVDREIEHIGLDALTNVLLKPINLVVEVAYLDRTPGSDVNRYRFPAEANEQNPAELGPRIYLLFRPDHYDILYSREQPLTPAAPISGPPDPVSMQVNRVSGFSHNTEIASTHNDLGAYATMDFGNLDMLPGFSQNVGMSAGISPMESPAAPSPYFGSEGDGTWAAAGPQFTPHQQQQQPPPPPPPQPAPVVAAPPPPTSTATPLNSTASGVGGSPIYCEPLMAQPSPAQGQGQGPGPGLSFRFSQVQLEYDEGRSVFPESTFNVKTTTFRNSVYNRAHFGNPSFHPEEWRPEDDNMEGRIEKRKKGRRDL